MFSNQPNHRTPKIHLTVRPNPKEAESKDISTLISDRLQSLTLSNQRGFEADQLDITLDDSDGALALPSRGALLSLAFGWSDQPLIFKGEYSVDEVEHSGAPDILTIRARSADLRGSLMEQKERSFDRTTIGKIVKQIADENKLTPKVAQAFENEAIDHIDQANESAISFLTRLAEKYDAIATVKNGSLLFIPAGTGKTASGQNLPTIRITRQDGDSHRFAIAEGNNYKAVKAYWHDTDTGKRGEVIWDENSSVQKVYGKTKGRTITRAKRGQAGEVMRDSKGNVKKDKAGNVRTYKKGRILKDAQGNTIKETVYKAGRQTKSYTLEIKQAKPIESDSDSIRTLRHTYQSKTAAINAVKREFGKLQRGVASFSLTLAYGNAELMPELPVEVSGFKAEIDSTEWIITQVTHSISADGGFTSAIECELKTEEDKGAE